MHRGSAAVGILRSCLGATRARRRPTGARISKPGQLLVALYLSCTVGCQGNATEPVGTWTGYEHPLPALLIPDASVPPSGDARNELTPTTPDETALPINPPSETHTPEPEPDTPEPDTESESEPDTDTPEPKPDTFEPDDTTNVRDIDAGLAIELEDGPFIQSDHLCSDRWTPTEPVVPPQGCASLEWLDADVEVQGISADGSTLIGLASPLDPAQPASSQSFVWVRGQAIEYLDAGLRVNDVSDDGTWLVGARVAELGTSVPMVLGADRQPLLLSAAIKQGQATAVSGDGCVIVGNGWQDGDEADIRAAFHWTPQGGLASLPFYYSANITGKRYWSPVDVSGDGSVVLGEVGPFAPQNPPSAVVWTPDAGLEFVGSGRPFALSYDGATAVGDSGSPVSPSVSRLWRLGVDDSADSGVAESFRLEEPQHTASVLNANATVVFSEARPSGDDTTTQPHVWRAGVGTETLLSFLENSCIDTSVMPIVRWRVTAASADAKVVVGCAEVDGYGRCWVASWE